MSNVFLSESVPEAPVLPRLLLLTNEPPLTVGAGSIVFHRLFRDYPPERLRVVTNAPLAPAEQSLACRYEHLPLLADRLNRTRFWPLRAAARALGMGNLVSLRRIDRRLEDGFVPDVVVTLMQDSWMYDLAARYARHRRLPLVLFIHDLAFGFEPVAPWLRSAQRRRDAAVYRQAAARLCVSQGMADHFLAEFGVPGEVMLPPHSDQLPIQQPERCERLKQPGRLVLGYAGGLHYGYGEQLLAILPVLRSTGTKIELFGPTPGGSVAALQAATDVLHFNGYAPTPEEAWRSLLERCDALLQPYLNPPGNHALQYQTHFPSKLGDCLSLGLPVLITGPADASGVKWCTQHPGCALTISDPSPDALIRALERLRGDPEFRVSLAQQGQHAATAFAAGPLREKFCRALTTAEAGPPETVV
jgi:glycosyltransferase involved in cell wall biosynthesis